MWMRFLALVVALNILRYVLGAAVEPFLIFDGLFGAMEAAKDTFNTSFTTVDWVTSYFYNFMVWFACALVFHMARPAVSGRDVSASLRVFGIMWVFFASVSAVYMNHYSHPKDFYLWNIADALLVFAIVAICNGILYRRIMGPYAATNGSEP
jgi:hypothetical protein